MSARNWNIHLPPHLSLKLSYKVCSLNIPSKDCILPSNGIHDDVEPVLWDGNFVIGWMQYLRAGWMIDHTAFSDAGCYQNRRTRHSCRYWNFSKGSSHYGYWSSGHPDQERPTCRHGYQSAERKDNESHFGCLARWQEACRLPSNNPQFDQQYGNWSYQGEEKLKNIAVAQSEDV